MFKSLVSLTANRFLAYSGTMRNLTQTKRCMSHHNTESAEEFDNRYEKFFNKSEVDGWEIRKAMNDICGMDVVPDPKVINAALKACRRVNDYALAVRFLEAVKFKCGPHEKEIYPYILQEIKPIIEELGIDTPEQLGYDKPELALASVYNIH